MTGEVGNYRCIYLAGVRYSLVSCRCVLGRWPDGLLDDVVDNNLHLLAVWSFRRTQLF